MAARRLARRCQLEMSGGGVGVWSEVIALARIAGVIDLGQGWPDVPPSEVATAEAARILQDRSAAGRKQNQYSPIGGAPALCTAVSEMHRTLYGDALDPASEVCVVTSGTEALYASMLALCDPGDEVIMFEPFFPWYLPCARLVGAVPRVVTLEQPDFAIHEPSLRAAFNSKTKLILVNSPHNPTGRILTNDELALVAELCIANDVVAVFDEVYERTLFNSAVHRRLSSLEGMRERTINIGSAGKIYNLTGWRVGWITGPSELVAGIRTMHGYTTFCAPTPLQEGIAAAIRAEPPDFSRAVSDEFAYNWKLLADALTKMGVEVCCQGGDVGGYFLVCDVKSSGKSGLEWAKWLAAERGVACVPLSVFYEPRVDPTWTCTLVRFAICKQRETIVKACAKLVP